MHCCNIHFSAKSHKKECRKTRQTPFYCKLPRSTGWVDIKWIRSKFNFHIYQTFQTKLIWKWQSHPFILQGSLNIAIGHFCNEFKNAAIQKPTYMPGSQSICSRNNKRKRTQKVTAGLAEKSLNIWAIVSDWAMKTQLHMHVFISFPLLVFKKSRCIVGYKL